MEENHTQSIEPATTGKRRNDWKILSGILAVVVIVLLILMFSGKMTGNVISSKSAGDKLVDFLNTKTGGGVTYVSTEDLGNIYNVVVSYQGQNIPVYITKDGKYWIQGAVPMTGEVVSEDTDTPATQEPKNLTKSDKPVVELFVMTHCPYGTQAEKGMIPAIQALGSKVDANIRFVHYFMHGDKEEAETYNQVCIREEQKAKYLDYLTCFLEDGNSERCLTKVGIDKTKLTSCLANNSTKAKEYYAKDAQLSQKYGVQGSPTLVVNGAEVSSARDSASYLKTICSAFTTVPTAECSKQVSTASPSAGFGTAAAAAGTATDAQC